MPDYKIEAVANEVRSYTTQYGDMKSYKVKLPGVNDAVEVSQKASTPPPVAGDTLTGTVESSSFGPKFKKEFTPKAPGGGGGFGGGRPQSDPFTMYLSYAKDIAVARINAGIDKREVTDMIDEVLANAYIMYGGRPEAQSAVKTAEQANKVKDIFGEDEKIDEDDPVFDAEDMPKDFLTA